LLASSTHGRMEGKGSRRLNSVEVEGKAQPDKG
jgi:hypothetical protein